MQEQQGFAAFVGDTMLAAGDLRAVLTAVKKRVEMGHDAPLLIFDDRTGAQVDFDLRGSLSEVLARAIPEAKSPGPGRPKLGVVNREIGLLPRHWEWLEAQPSGASAALRRLVDEARARDPGAAHARQVRAAVSRVMTTLGGNLPDYEEATRALFAGDQAGFEQRIARWPDDVRAYLVRLSRECQTEGPKGL